MTQTRTGKKTRTKPIAEPLSINGTMVHPGSRLTIDLPVGKLYTHTPMSMPVHVIHGTTPGPRLFVCAAIHGDEINGVEIIRRLFRMTALTRLRGSLLLVPIVNVHGLLNQSRYLPDRRDLNRSFPGSNQGSLAARLAHLFMREIVSNCTHGVDLHTGALHRSNLPQVRADLRDPETHRLARAFDVPVLISASTRDGSLRESAANRGIPTLLYEAGEALRFDAAGIRIGFNGVLNMMRMLKMLPGVKTKVKAGRSATVAKSTYWIRAASSGIFRPTAGLGARIAEESPLGVVSDPFGEKETAVIAPADGIIIGRSNLPLVNEGDALFHVARFHDEGVKDARLEESQEPAPSTLGSAGPEGPLY